MSAADAVDAVRDAATAVGLEVAVPSDAGADLVLVNPAGGRVLVDIQRMSLVSAGGLAERIKDDSQRAASAVPLLVADRVTREARQILDAAGWSWLDLRGHVHLVGQGMFVDSDVPAVDETPRRSAPLAGQVGIEVATVLLLDPETPAAVRRIANALGRAPSSVSAALAGMAADGLVDGDRVPAVPELFWELATRWQPQQVHVQHVPIPGDKVVDNALHLGLTAVEQTTGWALGDTVAAAAYGAPIGARADQPLDFYVPDQSTQRRAARLLGEASGQGDRAATVRIAPVPLVCSRRVDATGRSDGIWPLAQPLFVALDLARDPGRGREILAGWTPDDRWHRVW